MIKFPDQPASSSNSEHAIRAKEFVENMKTLEIGMTIEFNAFFYVTPVHNGYVLYPKYNGGVGCFIPYE